MIKTVFQFICLFILFQSCKGQPENGDTIKPNFIDSIHSAKQLTELITKIDSRYNSIRINETLEFESEYCELKYKKVFGSLIGKPWTKADFDSNGLTDILIIGKWDRFWDDHLVICILDKGGSYEINRIKRKSFGDCIFPIVENQKIKYHFESKPIKEKLGEPRGLEYITLTYKYGNFIEENGLPIKHNIEKIEYATTGCYGTCPIFTIRINSDRTAKWYADMYNEIEKKEWTGNFKSTISVDKFEELQNLLNYIDFENLKDSYNVNWTDDQTSTLKITYDNGKIKSIKDYGLIGTYGLDRVYQLLFGLRQNQKWRK